MRWHTKYTWHRAQCSASINFLAFMAVFSSGYLNVSIGTAVQRSRVRSKRWMSWNRQPTRKQKLEDDFLKWRKDAYMHINFVLIGSLNIAPLLYTLGFFFFQEISLISFSSDPGSPNLRKHKWGRTRWVKWGKKLRRYIIKLAICGIKWNCYLVSLDSLLRDHKNNFLSQSFPRRKGEEFIH